MGKRPGRSRRGPGRAIGTRSGGGRPEKVVRLVSHRGRRPGEVARAARHAGREGGDGDRAAGRRGGRRELPRRLVRRRPRGLSPPRPGVPSRHRRPLRRLPSRVHPLPPRPPPPRAQPLLVDVQLAETIEGGEEAGDGGLDAVEAADRRVLRVQRRLARAAVAVDASEGVPELGERPFEVRRPGGRIGPQAMRPRRRQGLLRVPQPPDHPARLGAQILGMPPGAPAEAEDASRGAGAPDALARGADADQPLVQQGGGAVPPLACLEGVALLDPVRGVRRLERLPRVVEQPPQGLLQPIESEGFAVRHHPRQQRLHPLRRLRRVRPRRLRHHPGVPLPPRDPGRRHRSPPPPVGRGGPEAAGSGPPTSAGPRPAATGRKAGASPARPRRAVAAGRPPSAPRPRRGAVADVAEPSP